MNRRYLPIGIIVLIIGVGFILLPQKIEMHIAPELVTVWETMIPSFGEYSLDTGQHEIGNVMAPYVRLWTNASKEINTTFTLVGEEGDDFTYNTLDNPAEFMLPSDGTVQVLITGEFLEEGSTMVNAGLFYLNPMEPEIITFYPYRFFGYGMVVIGVLASIVFYLRKAPRVNP